MLDKSKKAAADVRLLLCGTNWCWKLLRRLNGVKSQKCRRKNNEKRGSDRPEFTILEFR
jgi:hypothetical protein